MRTKGVDWPEREAYPATMAFERYPGVQGHRNVARFCDAIEACGAEIVRKPDPRVAPFDLAIRTPGGHVVELVAYAFTANEYGQLNRPKGEHRFQLKYGSDFQREHEIFYDPTRRRITLMFGVHHELDLFVCVDPQMHNPTWFSMSVEFKADELRKARETGWHSWERERSSVRRVLEMPRANLATEAVGAFTPENFLRYIAFEAVASGVDTGERGLLWEKAGRGELESPPFSAERIGHSLESLLGLPASEILDVVQEHFRLLVALRGSVAERHLGQLLRDTSGVEDVRPLDEDGKPDFLVRYRSKEIRIECKNTLRSLTAQGLPRVDFQKTRASKNDPCSRYYLRDQFEVLAACLHPVCDRWEFLFCPTAALAPHPRCENRLAANVVVGGSAWGALDEIEV